MSLLEIRLLGRPEIRVDGVALEGLPAKLEALVYYLAVAPRSVSRSALAGLLWGDRTEQDARMNLRAALQKIPAALAPHLVVTRETIALDRNRQPHVDVHRLDAALDALAAAAQPPAERLGDLASVATLYRDDFLAGFAVGHAREFDEWCAAERTRLRQGAVRVLTEALRLARAAGRDDDVCANARRILQIEPGHDGALRELMQALARSGQRHSAVEEYERHTKHWRDDLRIAPSEEAIRLAERIVAGEPLEGVAKRATPPVVALIGRERELALVAGLHSGTTSIVSVTGLGGIGKTRLAQALMAELSPRFADGAAFFSAGAMRSGRALGPALAAGFGLRQQGGPVTRLLQDYVREKSMLLVLDSFESLLGTEAVDLVLELVHAAPGLRVLVTSREALGVAEETPVALEGLAFPRGEGGDDWRDSAAVQLFIQRASRGYVQFDPERERTGILRICERVEGVPLALELAAAMARTLPCVEIARAIERDLGTLARDDATLSPRHRSLSGVLTCAWSQLPAELQDALARLAIFSAPFSAEAAERVAGCSLRQLSTLIEKSWLRRDAAMGYAQHDLIRQFARGQALSAEERRELSKRHGLYFLESLAAQRAALLTGVAAQIAHVQAVMPDILDAFEWGLAGAPDDPLEPACEALFRYHESWSDYASVEDFLAKAIAKLERQKRASRRAVLARFVTHHGLCKVHAGQFDEAIATCERAAALARERGSARVLAEAIRGLAIARAMTGRPDPDMIDEAIALSQGAGDAHGECAAVLGKGIVMEFTENPGDAAPHYLRAIELARPLDYLRAHIVATGNLGALRLAQGDYADAERCFRESMALAKQVGDRRTRALAVSNLAAVALGRGQYGESHAFLDEAIELARALGSARLACPIYQGYAELAVVARRWEESLEWADRMVAEADRIGWAWSAAFGVALRSEALVQLARRDEAWATLRDLHARVQGIEFPIHHGNLALEASRWMLHFAPGAAAAIAAGALHAIVRTNFDTWLCDRARACIAERGVGEVEPLAGNVRDVMAVAFAACEKAAAG